MKSIKLFALAGASLGLSFTLSAQGEDPVTTQPVGYTTWTINAGTGSARTITSLALPLYQPSQSVQGVSAGVISSVSNNSISVANAGWDAGELSNAVSPFCLRITSGEAEGRNLLVSTTSPNGVDSLVVDLSASGVSDLTSLGISAGVDTFELIEVDTLASLFGAPSSGGVVGGSTQDSADVIFLFVNGSWSRYYFDTDLGNWKRVSFFDNDASNQVIMPDAGILYSRLSDTTSSFVITGTVPDTSREISINSSGVTFLGNAWPVDVALSETGIENISNWNSSTSRNSADKVFVLTSTGSWKRYFHDGTNWKEVSFFEPVSNNVVISAGTAVLLVKGSGSTGTVKLEQSLPYSL